MAPPRQVGRPLAQRGLDNSETEKRRLAVRSAIITLSEEGYHNAAIATRLGVSKATVAKWINRSVVYSSKLFCVIPLKIMNNCWCLCIYNSQRGCDQITLKGDFYFGDIG